MDTSHLYRLYLKAPNLPEDGCNLKIEKATIERVHPRPGEQSDKVILWFKDRQNRLRAFILNQGNYNSLVNLTNTTDAGKWAGVEVFLKPAKWGGQDTVLLRKPRNGNE